MLIRQCLMSHDQEALLHHTYPVIKTMAIAILFLVQNSIILLKGFGCFLYDTKHKRPQIDIKLTRFKDNDSRKLRFKYYLLRYGSYWEISKTISRKAIFCLSEMKIILACTVFRNSPENIALWCSPFFPSKSCWLMKLKLLQVLNCIFIHRE